MAMAVLQLFPAIATATHNALKKSWFLMWLYKVELNSSRLENRQASGPLAWTCTAGGGGGQPQSALTHLNQCVLIELTRKAVQNLHQVQVRQIKESSGKFVRH